MENIERRKGKPGRTHEVVGEAPPDLAKTYQCNMQGVLVCTHENYPAAPCKAGNISRACVMKQLDCSEIP